MANPADLLLPADLPSGPMLIGATGGSGTRAVARIVQQAGVWIGSNLNVSVDAVDFGLYSNRWIDAFLKGTDRWRRPLGEGDRAAMIADLQPLLRGHLEPLTEPEHLGRWTAWGWKEPRSMYLLPFWDALFPDLRFLHVVRDGRDMAFSSNQNQLLKHGATMLGEEDGGQPEAVRSIALWGRANTLVAEYAAAHLRERYLRVRFEDLCGRPAATVSTVLGFFGLPGAAAALAAELVVPPHTLGRWRNADPELLATLHRVAGSALARLGYPVPWRIRLANAWRLRRPS